MVPLLCAFISLLIGVSAVALSVSVQDGKISALVRMQPDEPMAQIAREADPGFAFTPQGHYDGVYAYAIAIDPLALGDSPSLIDFPAYRYGRAAYGWAAGLVSLGSAAKVPTALFLVNLIGLVGGAFGASLIAGRLGLSGWGGLLVALNPGIIYGLTADTSEPFSAGLLAAGLLCWFGSRRTLAAVIFAVLCLTKEPFVAVPVGLMIWEFVAARRAGTLAEIKPRLGLLAASIAPLPLWWTYVHAQIGEWPTDQPGFVTLPLVGWLDTMKQSAGLGLSGFYEQQIGAIQLPFLVVIAGALILGSIWSLRVRNPLQPIFLGFVAVATLFNWYQLLFAKELFRILAIPLLLLPGVFAARRGWDSGQEETPRLRKEVS
jgi:hypothetical protein